MQAWGGIEWLFCDTIRLRMATGRYKEELGSWHISDQDLGMQSA